jgi:hypothetical protein
MRYQSSFDALKLIRDAKKELARSEPEQYKVFLLAVMAGLHAGERSIHLNGRRSGGIAE